MKNAINPGKTCKTCKYYIQHYGKGIYNYFALNCGHCIEPLLKHRTPDTKACSNYILRQPGDEPLR